MYRSLRRCFGSIQCSICCGTIRASKNSLLPRRSLNAAVLDTVLTGLRATVEVHPVAALPGDALSAGCALAIVNRGVTPWDSRAELVLDAGAGETLRGLATALGIVEPERARRSDG